MGSSCSVWRCYMSNADLSGNTAATSWAPVACWASNARPCLSPNPSSAPPARCSGPSRMSYRGLTANGCRGGGRHGSRVAGKYVGWGHIYLTSNHRG